MEITRDNAVDMQVALDAEQQQLRAELDAATDPAARTDIYRRAVTNLERQALAWERRPGRTRDKREPAARCRYEARLCGAAAAIEQLRAHAATSGRDLPDPRVLIAGITDPMSTCDAAVEALIALYTAAAETP